MTEFPRLPRSSSTTRKCVYLFQSLHCSSFLPQAAALHCDWSAVRKTSRAVWRCFTQEAGARSATTNGTTGMLRWCAGSWALGMSCFVPVLVFACVLYVCCMFVCSPQSLLKNVKCTEILKIHFFQYLTIVRYNRTSVVESDHCPVVICTLISASFFSKSSFLRELDLVTCVTTVTTS